MKGMNPSTQLLAVKSFARAEQKAADRRRDRELYDELRSLRDDFDDRKIAMLEAEVVRSRDEEGTGHLYVRGAVGRTGLWAAR